MDFTTIPWQEIGELSLIVLFSLSFLAVVALPLMGIGGQTLSLIRQRSSYAKCAKQVTVLALILGWIITLASFYPLWKSLSPSILPFLPMHFLDGQSMDIKAFFSHMADGALLQNIFQKAVWEPVAQSVYLQAHVYATGLLLLASICLTAFFKLWNKWKTHRVAVQCLALVSSTWYGMALFDALSIMSADTALASGVPYATRSENFFIPSLEATFWNGAPYVLPLAFALAGGLACIWLLLRRHRDDFGRDYYAQMLPWCASWARNGWLLYWLILMATTAIQWMNLVQQENYLSSPDFIHSCLFLLLWSIPGILWTLVMRSEHPLRHKPTLILAFVFAMMTIVPIYQSI